MYNRLLIFLFCAVSCSNATGQRNINLANSSLFPLQLEEIQYTGTEKIPFNSIQVFDYRFDSSKLGYYYYASNADKIVFERNQTFNEGAMLNRYFKNNLDPKASQSLAIIIKSFWMQQGYLTGEPRGKMQTDYYYSTQDRRGICLVDMDVFAVSETGLKALTKLESGFALGPYTAKKLRRSFYTAFDSLINKISSINVEKILPGKRNFKWDEVHKNYSKRFELPALTSANTQKGVYLTFDDFKQNKITYTDFNIREDKLTDQVYVKQGQGEQLLTEYWGFYDGKDYYLRIGLNFFKLIRQQNTFDLMGARYISRQYQDYGTSYVRLHTQSTKLNLRPMQVDMDTGVVY